MNSMLWIQAFVFTLVEVIILYRCFVFKPNEKVNLVLFGFILLLRNGFYQLGNVGASSVLGITDVADSIMFFEIGHLLMGVAIIFAMFKVVAGRLAENVLLLEAIKLIMLVINVLIRVPARLILESLDDSVYSIGSQGWWVTTVSLLIWSVLSIWIIGLAYNYLRGAISGIRDDVKNIIALALIALPNLMFTSPNVLAVITANDRIKFDIIVWANVAAFFIIGMILFVESNRAKVELKKIHNRIVTDFNEYDKLEKVYGQMRKLRHEVANGVIAGDDKFREEILRTCYSIKKELGDNDD